MIVLEPGFKAVHRQWPECVNKHRDEVEKILKQDLPNVECRVFGEDEFKHCSEEFYFLKIALVVNDGGVVVCVPRYFGAEPDLDQLANPIGKDYKTVCGDITRSIPSVKVVVENKNGDQKWSSNDSVDHYLLVKVDGHDKVIELPSYVRVAKKE